MPQYSIQGPDGKTYTIEGPAGATREQVIAKIKERLAADTAPPEPEGAAVAKDVATSFAVGIPKGVMDVVGVPGDVQELGRNYNPFDYLADQYREAFPKTAAANVKRAERVGRVSEIGEIRLPTTQEVRGRVEKATGPLYEPKTEPGRYAGAIGEAAATAALQPGGPAVKALTTLGAGVGAQAGGEVAEAVGLPEGVGRAAGGIAGGGVSGMAAASGTAARARRLLPTSAENRTAAKNAADAIAAEKLIVDPAALSSFATQLRADLASTTFTPLSSSRTFQSVKNLGKSKGDLQSIIDTHSNLGKIPPREGSDYAAAMFARDKIREWLANLQPSEIVGRGDPALASQLWQFHRDTWRIHSNLEEIYGALESAEWRRMVSGRGTNLNTIRQNIRRILDNDNLVRRYDPRAREAMEQIVEGDLARNTMRKLAAFAPHGPVSAIPTALAGMTGGADLGVGVAAGGFIAHLLQGKLEQRSLDALLDIIREGSPLTGPEAREAVARARQPIASRATARGAVLAPGGDSPLDLQSPLQQ